MADKTLSSSVLTIDGTVFIEDLVLHVFKVHGIQKDKSLPDGYLDTLRSIAEYAFSTVIGQAVVERMKRLPEGIANACIEKAKELRLDSPYQGDYMTNYLMRAKVTNLTHAIFHTDRARWCAEVFEYLVLITDLCVVLHQSQKLGEFMEVISVAGNSFHNLVNEEPSEKMKSLEEYATKILTNPDNPNDVICLE